MTRPFLIYFLEIYTPLYPHAGGIDTGQARWKYSRWRLCLGFSGLPPKDVHREGTCLCLAVQFEWPAYLQWCKKQYVYLLLEYKHINYIYIYIHRAQLILAWHQFKCAFHLTAWVWNLGFYMWRNALLQADPTHALHYDIIKRNAQCWHHYTAQYDSTRMLKQFLWHRPAHLGWTIP